ncbi:TPA: hypothetical protein ACHHU1_002762, partial [Staphylococcus aureus]
SLNYIPTTFGGEPIKKKEFSIWLRNSSR